MTPQNWVISEALASSVNRKPRAPQPFLTVVIKKLPWLECSGHCCSILSKSQIMLAVVSVSRNRCLLTHFLLTSQSWWLNTRISTDAQSCLTLCDPMDYTVRGILQARILECVAIPISRGSSQPRDGIQVSWIAGGFFTSWTTKKAPTDATTKESEPIW